MTSWEDKYKRKLMSIEDAIKSLPPKATVIVGMAAMEAQGLLTQVHKHEDHFEYLKVGSCLNLGDFPFCQDKKYEGTFCNDNWFFGPSTRKAAKLGYKIVDYMPNNLHRAGWEKAVAEKEDGNYLVFWGAVTPMQSKSGYFNLGISNVYEHDVMQLADKIILEVNPFVPHMHGETQVHIDEVDGLVEYENPLPTIPIPQPTEVEEMIAGHIADLVDDGSTLQIGIGGIPNAVAKLLKNKKDLGVHTEMFTESMIELFEEGVITNRKKNFWPGKFVCTFAMGTQNMYDWIDDNPGILVLKGRYVNDPYVIARNDNMVSINTALSVDLTGQVASESLGATQFSGTGGQLDTHRGATMSKGGKGIIALRSTAKGGTISTITPALVSGSIVSVPRHDLDTVVTEYGVARLRGRTVSKRTEALISIAHPDFRKELRSEARKLGHI
jgi:acyl-CoA hydrolase